MRFVIKENRRRPFGCLLTSRLFIVGDCIEFVISVKNLLRKEGMKMKYPNRMRRESKKAEHERKRKAERKLLKQLAKKTKDYNGIQIKVLPDGKKQVYRRFPSRDFVKERKEEIVRRVQKVEAKAHARKLARLAKRKEEHGIEHKQS